MEDLIVRYYSEDSIAKIDAVNDLVSSLSTGACSALSLMEGLHEHLTSSEVDERLKPLELIAAVLSKLHPSHIKANECGVLVEFLCCRLQDHFSLHPPTLNALSTLSARSDLPMGTAEAIAKILFKEIHVPSYMQSERRSVFEILSNLLDNYSNELKKMNDDFVYGVVAAVDGEQDPRNLLKVFDLMFSIVKSGFNITKIAEEFFEVVGCYFPIDFEPPSNLSENKVIITNEQLVDGLRRVITSSPLFAPYCLPLITEKIESDVQSAKIDAIETLRECLKIYSVTVIKPYLHSIWICLRNECIQSKSKVVEDMCQLLLKDIIILLSKSPQHAKEESVLDKFLKDVIEDCLPNLSGRLQEKMAWSSSQLMISAAKASKRSCEIILSSLIPIVFSALENKNLMIAEKRLAMEIIVSSVKAASLHSFDNDPNTHPFLRYKDDVIELFCNCVTSQEFVHLRTVALAGNAAMCNLGLVITPENQLTIVHSLIYCLQHEKDETILKDLHITCGFLAAKWPDVAMTYFIPMLKDKLTNIFTCTQKERYNCIKMLCAISTNIEITSATCELLLELLISKTVNEDNSSAIIDCLDGISCIVKGNSDKKVFVDSFADTLITPLVEICVKLSLTPVLPEQCCKSCSGLQSFSNQCITWPIMQKACEIIRTICQRLGTGDRAGRICTAMTEIIIESSLDKLNIDVQELPFNPFLNTKLPLQTRLVSLLTASYCAFDSGVKVAGLSSLMENLLSLCGQTTDQPSYTSASKCLAGLLNKHPDCKILDKVIQLAKCLFDEDTTDEKRVAILSLVVWVNKALVLRSHEYTMEFSGILFRLFADEKLGKVAADSFDIILRSSEEVLNESCHSCIRLMHKQRFFQSVLPKLTAGFQDVEILQSSAMDVDGSEGKDFSQIRANYLTALSHLLHYLPKQVLNQHLTSLLPLLIKSLNSDEGPLLVSVLSTIYNLTQEAKSSLVPHVEMLLNHFLKLSAFPNNMQVRIQALRCVGVMTLLPVDVVLPHKKRIVRELSSTLDDKKRLVRKDAVKARTEWCLLGDI